MAKVPKKPEVKLELLTDIDVINGKKKTLEAKYVMQYIDMQQKTINT